MNQESHDFSRAECQEEMTVYKPGTTYPDTKAMAEKTKEHLASGTPVICEAAFLNYNNYCAADILRKTDAGYDMYEVKNSPEVDDQYIKDAAFQYYIISKCHTKIDQIYIVIHGQDEENPFVPVNVTEKAKEVREDVICLETADMDFKTAPEIIEDLKKITETVSAMTGDSYRLMKFFPSLSDSSYLRIDDDEESLQSWKNSFPGLGKLYDVPLDQIRRLNIPAVDFGCYGKDAHKRYERVNLPYTFKTLPVLIRETLKYYRYLED